MGFFGGCSHEYKKYGRKNKGMQQYKCRKCGRLRMKKVKTFMCMHRWKMDRRRRDNTLTCQKCGKVQPDYRAEVEWT